MQRHLHTEILKYIKKEKKVPQEETRTPSQYRTGPHQTSHPVCSVCDQATCKCLDGTSCLIEQVSTPLKEKRKQDETPVAGFVPCDPVPPSLDKGCILGFALELDRSSSIFQSRRLDWRRQRNSRWSFCSLELKDLVNLVTRQLRGCCVQIQSRKQLPYGESKRSPMHIQKSEMLAVVWFP